MTFRLDEFNAMARDRPSVVQYRGAVVSVHGMATRGEWQKVLTPVLSDALIRHVPIDYGYAVFSVLRPKTVRTLAGKIADAWTEQCEYVRTPSAIGHSFGSLAIGKTLQLKPDVGFSRIIVYGCILPRSFPWQTLASRGQVEKVLNEYSPRDRWPRFPLRRLIPGSGDAGCFGFEDCGDVVVQTDMRWTEHSDLQHRSHYTRRWIPFLLGEA
jgi:hypothetical protein